MEVKQLGNLTEDAKRENPGRRRVYDPNGLSPTLQAAMGNGGNLQPFVVVENKAIKKIPCQLDKSDFQTLDEAGIKNINTDVAGTISARYYKGIGGNGDNMVIEVSEKRLGNIYGFDGGNYAGNVYDTESLAPTIRTYQGGNQQPMIIEDKIICAMRGRNPESPSDRTAGIPIEQRLEPNSQGICNCLTSVSKDNMVLENICINDRGFTNKEPQVSIGTVPTLRAEIHGNLPKVIESTYRIRKLTPRECYRLMSFSDEDYEKAAAVNSNTQLYKSVGNSICRTVLCALFSQLNIKDIKPWNDMSQGEREGLINIEEK